jgi:hypothetical protein
MADPRRFNVQILEDLMLVIKRTGKKVVPDGTWSRSAEGGSRVEAAGSASSVFDRRVSADIWVAN